MCNSASKKIYNLINNYMTDFFDEDFIYNEFSFQHELGIYLREQLQEYKIQFERNVCHFYKGVETIKKEIDIVIINTQNENERYAIELKYPKNGQYPEQMYSFVKDIKFMEELKELNFTNCYCVTLVNDKLFYSGNYRKDSIYSYFRIKNLLKGIIYKPTGQNKNTENISLNGSYEIQWIDSQTNEKNHFKYYLIKI